MKLSVKGSEILWSVRKGLNKLGNRVQKSSPELLLGAGIVAVVTGAVMACKATVKAEDILAESHEKLDKIHKVAEDETYTDTYTKEDEKKDLTIVYAQTGLKLVKVYAPAVAVGTLGVVSILASHNILHKRNVALAAAYTTVDQSFKDYRKRVVERFGERVDHELKHAIKAETMEKTETTEDGKKKKVKETVDVVDKSALEGKSEYARFFDERSYFYEKDAEQNLMFLKKQQNYANQLLRSKGKLFLNDVYDMLDIPRTKAGQIVGWVYNPENPNIDNYVDFGIYDLHCRENRDFVNGYERAILLDFNVDGPIWDLLP
jgi:hypothetical protein